MGGDLFTAEALILGLDVNIDFPEIKRRVHLVSGSTEAAPSLPSRARETRQTGSSSAEWGTYFRRRNVVILPHNDPEGYKHVLAVACHLRPHIATLQVLVIPGLPVKGDIVDFQREGGTAEDFAQFLDACPRIVTAGQL